MVCVAPAAETRLVELRTYTLADAAALNRYIDEFWPRHIRTLRAYGIDVHGVWTDAAGPHRVIALVGYRPGADPQRLAATYRDSQDFLDDHAHFDPGLIIATEVRELTPIACSGLR